MNNEKPISASNQAILSKLMAMAAKTAALTNQIAQCEALAVYGGIQLDEYQQQFVNLIKLDNWPNSPIVLTGAAGSGKTTVQNAATTEMLRTGKAGIFTGTHKYLTHGTPGIVVVAYTNRAVNNIRRKLPQELQGNAITLHKLLEYVPVEEEVFDEEKGEFRTRKIFRPGRDETNPLDSSIRVYIFEEASQIGLDLFNQFAVALPNGPLPLMIFLGDINQLPPIFSPGILGYKGLEAIKAGTYVNLKNIHRQALDNPIIAIAHSCLKGELPKYEEKTKLGPNDEVVIIPLKKRVPKEMAAALICRDLFYPAFKTGQYNPMDDLILIPHNVGYGTIAVNARVATFFAKERDAEVYEVSAGFIKSYYSVGDKVMHAKQEWIVESILPNPKYDGFPTKPQSKTLDYFGVEPSQVDERTEEEIESALEKMFELHADDNSEDGESKSRAASHVIKLSNLDDPDLYVDISTQGEVNAMCLAYATTIHKAQGSEAQRVWLLLHHSHMAMVNNELIYTGMTRAKQFLRIICEKDSIYKGCRTQRIAGASAEVKMESFKGKIIAGLVPLV
jgi:ATP-dependent exoDNAse (exonuclease V) alpha subunit